VRLQWRLLAFQLHLRLSKYCLIHRCKIPDGVISAKTDPVRDRAILLHLLAQDTAK
jgi:hypothetical protein